MGETPEWRALFWGDWFPGRKVTGHGGHTEELARRQMSEDVWSIIKQELWASCSVEAFCLRIDLLSDTWQPHSHKDRDSFQARFKFRKCERLQNVVVDSLKRCYKHLVKKQHLDLHLLFSHNQDSYKYPLRGQNHRSSLHCSQIKGCFSLPGHDECTIIKQFHNQAAFP